MVEGLAEYGRVILVYGRRRRDGEERREEMVQCMLWRGFVEEWRSMVGQQ